MKDVEFNYQILKEENIALKEKLLDLEYRQRRNNLLFDGLPESVKETDANCYEKVKAALGNISELDPNNIWIDRCHRLGPKSNKNKQIICCFSYYSDVSKILADRKNLPKGVYVNEDLPEDWSDRRRVLKPIYNLAKAKISDKKLVHWSKDKLVIRDKEYTVAPISNLVDLTDEFNLASTCERQNSEVLAFQGIHSIFSNFHPTNFVVGSTSYVNMEQFIQAQKAVLFDDDTTHRKIMLTKSPYKAKRLGKKVRKFDDTKWKQNLKENTYTGLKAKFLQNGALVDLLLSTKNMQIVEATYDRYWGTGVPLKSHQVLDQQSWYNTGLMCELYQRLRAELSNLRKPNWVQHPTT